MFLLSACGGPSKEAIVANTIQTIMATLIEANVTILLSGELDPLDPVNCAGGGTLSVNDASFGTYDPGTGDTVIGPATVDFDQCVIRVCEGKNTTLDGDDLFTIKFTANAQIGFEELSDVALVATSSGLAYAGELSGNLDFSYSLEGELSDNTFGGIVVGEGDPAENLVYEGFEYIPEEIPDLADGC